MNTVCTNIIRLHQKKLQAYGGECRSFSIALNMPRVSPLHGSAYFACVSFRSWADADVHARPGNYDTYIKTRAELEDAQMKKHKWEQDQISHMKEYIARFGHGSAKLARQAQSKEKTLEKMVQAPCLPCCLYIVSIQRCEK